MTTTTQDDNIVTIQSLAASGTTPVKDILITPGNLGTGTSQIELKWVASATPTSEIKTIIATAGERVGADGYDSPAISVSGYYNGAQQPANIFFHPRYGGIDATLFTGNLTGNVTGNITGSVNGLTLTPNADGFSVAGGTTSRTLTLSGGSLTITAASAGSTLAIGTGGAIVTGTALTSFTSGGVIYATSATNTSVASTGVGSATQVLLGGATPTFGSVNLGTMVTGVLPYANGGTGISTVATNGQILVGNGSGFALSNIAVGASSGLSVNNGAGTITLNSNATSANTAQTLVMRDASGNFSAGAITVSQLITTTGTVSTTPSGGTDIANKNYVDSTLAAVNAGLSTKGSSRVATNSAADVNFASFSAVNGGQITTSSAVTVIDGVTLAVGNRVLIKDLTGANQPYNGIYTVQQLTAGVQFQRSTDTNSTAGLAEGSYTLVEEGTTNANQGWIMNVANTTLNTTPLSWTQFTGVGDILAGQGLNKSGNTLSANISLANSTTSYTLAGGSTNQVSLQVVGTASATPFVLTGASDGYTLSGGIASSRTLTVNTGNITLQGNGGTLTMGTGNITLTGNGNTLNLGGNTTFSGSNAVTLTSTGATTVTLPTTGTLLTSAGTVSQLIATGSSAAVALRLQGTSNGTANNIFEAYTSGQTVGSSTPAIYVTNAGVLTGNGSGLTNISSASLSTVMVGQGGTGLTSVANGTLIYGSGGTSLSALGIGTSGTVLISNGTTPTWGTISLSNASPSISGILGFANGGVGASLAGATAGSLAYVGTAGTAGSLTSLAIGASGGVLWTNGSTPAWVGAGTAGTFLQSNGSAVPTWVSAVTSVSAGIGITITGTTTPSVAVNQAFAPTWTGAHTFSGSNYVPISVVDTSDASTARVRVDLTTGQQALVLGSDSITSPRNVPIVMTAIASGAISANTLVKFPTSGGTASGVVQAATTDTSEVVIGVALKGVASGASTYVAIDGKVSVNADAVAVAVGDYLILSGGTAGYVTSAGQTKPAGGYVGRAMSAKGATAGLVDMFLFPNQSTTTGSVVGTGTQYDIAMFTATGSQIGNSIITQNGAGNLVTVSGALTTTGVGTIGGASLTIGGATVVGALNLPSATTNTAGVNFGTDVNVYRAAANTLKTDDSFVALGGLTAGPGTFTVASANGSTTIKPTADVRSLLLQPSADANVSKVIEQMNAAGTVSQFSVDTNGVLAATQKRFEIQHPTKAEYKLVHGCLEGPENGIYQRGEANGKGEVRVEFPDYWTALTGTDYNLSVTPKGNYRVYIASKDDKGFTIKRTGGFFSRFQKFAFEFIAIGARQDVPITVETLVNK